MAKGLTLARSFYLAGHRVIGADFEHPRIPCSGRFSRSLAAFYRLPRVDGDDNDDSESTKTNTNTNTNKVYSRALRDIIEAENVDLWVSCSGVASAVEDAQAKEFVESHTSCKCIQFDVATTAKLHNKRSFATACKKLGLSVPETHEVTSKRDVHRILAACAKSESPLRFILKPVGVDDAHRADMTLLPLATKVETERHVYGLPISETSPWILQEYIPGGEEYCTHALVVRGEVKCFVVCPSADMLMHYTPVSPASPLWRAMLDFTAEFVRRSARPEDMTGHLSFDFMASEGMGGDEGRRKKKKKKEKRVFAIECNPRAHTAAVLFDHRGEEAEAMVRAYLSAVEGTQKGEKTKSLASAEDSLVVPSNSTRSRYWIGHDVVSLLLYPGLRWGMGFTGFRCVLAAVLDLVSHVLLWKDGTFEIWDPLPAVLLYHVYWPLVMIEAWWYGRRWSRINVSTTKVFGC